MRSLSEELNGDGPTDPQILALRALSIDYAKGSAMVLKLLPYLVLRGEELIPEFQVVVNAFFSEVIIGDVSLLTSVRGRPSGAITDEENKTTLRYMQEKAKTYGSGVKKSREEILAELEDELGVGERQIGRHISKTKARIEADSSFRVAIGCTNIDHYSEFIRELWMQENSDSFMAKLEALIDGAVSKITDINSSK